MSATAPKTVAEREAVYGPHPTVRQQRALRRTENHIKAAERRELRRQEAAEAEKKLRRSLSAKKAAATRRRNRAKEDRA